MVVFNCNYSHEMSHPVDVLTKINCNVKFQTKWIKSKKIQIDLEIYPFCQKFLHFAREKSLVNQALV